jgi:hypothetical protein
MSAFVSRNRKLTKFTIGFLVFHTSDKLRRNSDVYLIAGDTAMHLFCGGK